MVKAAETLGIDPASGHPERALALGYAPADRREALAALFALDATLGRLTRGTRDAMVAQLRLTWWHDALARLGEGTPPAQPILRALAKAKEDGVALGALVEGWEALLDGDAAAHGRGRRALFAAAGRLLGASGDPVAAAGEGWALADLAVHAVDPAIAATARALAVPMLAEACSVRWSRAGRPLGALAHVARMDLGERAPGSPLRVARLLRHRITGG